MTKRKEIPMKQWVFEQAAREHLSPSAVAQRVHRGHYHLSLHRINSRVVYVRITDGQK